MNSKYYLTLLLLIVLASGCVVEGDQTTPPGTQPTQSEDYSKLDVYGLLETESYSELNMKYDSEGGFRETISNINLYYPQSQHAILLDFVKDVEDSARKDWDEFARVVGRGDSGDGEGLVLWQNSPHFEKMLEFGVQVQGSTSKNWRGFASVIGLEAPAGSAGLIVWKHSPHFERMLDFAVNVQEPASKNWLTFAVFVGRNNPYGGQDYLIAWKESPHFEELLDIIQQEMPSKGTSSLTSALNNADGDFNAFKEAVLSGDLPSGAEEMVRAHTNALGNSDYAEAYSYLSEAMRYNIGTKEEYVSIQRMREREQGSRTYEVLSVEYVGETEAYASVDVYVEGVKRGGRIHLVKEYGEWKVGIPV